jgi:hypothetical protein
MRYSLDGTVQGAGQERYKNTSYQNIKRKIIFSVKAVKKAKNIEIKVIIVMLRQFYFAII